MLRSWKAVRRPGRRPVIPFTKASTASKTFGELVEHELDTRLSADDLAGMQEKGGDFIILDGRTPEEYIGLTSRWYFLSKRRIAVAVQ